MSQDKLMLSPEAFAQISINLFTQVYVEKTKRGEPINARELGDKIISDIITFDKIMGKKFIEKLEEVKNAQPVIQKAQTIPKLVKE